jgi:hypothetical protein
VGHRKRSSRRRRGSRRTPGHHRLTAEYALENPLSGGELALAFLTGGIGWAATDFLARFLSTTAGTTGQAASAVTTTNSANIAVSNDVVTDAFPSMGNIAAQVGMTAVPGIAAYFVHSPMGRASLQGLMLGAGMHLFGDLFKGLMAKALHDNNLGKRLYLAEIMAQDIANNTIQSPPGGTLSGVGAVPNGQRLRSNAFGRGFGQLPSTSGNVQPMPPTPIPTQGSFSSQTPPIPQGGGCGGCGDGNTEQSIASSLNNAFPQPSPGVVAQQLANTVGATRGEGCMGGIPTMRVMDLFPAD